MNMSPALGVEILNRILKIIKDYCGMLTEEAVRKNFALIYELLDEAIVGVEASAFTIGLWLSAGHLERGPRQLRAQQARGRCGPEGEFSSRV